MNHSQQVKNKSLFSNTLSIFLARFFPSLATTLVVIYFSRNLDKQSYGSYQNFWIQLNVLYPVACFGLHSVMLTYAPSVLVKLKEWLSFNSYLLYGFWVIALSIVFATVQYYSLHLHFAVSYLFLFAYALSFIIESILIVFRSFTTIVITNVLYAIAFFFFHWQMLHEGYSLQHLFACLLILCWIRLLIYTIVTYIQFRKQHAAEGEISIKDVRKLWLHLGVYDIVQTQSNWIDKFIISLLLSSGISAVYFNGTQNIPFLPILLSAASSAVLLQLGNRQQGDNTNHAVLLANQTGRLLSCVVFPLFFFLLFFRYEIYDLLYEGKYIQSVPIFFVSLFMLPIRAYSFTTILQHKHKGGMINTGAIAELLLACLLMYPLYHLMDLPGLALSFVISTYLQAVFYLIVTANTLQVTFFSLIPLTNWILKLIVFATVFIGIRYLFQQHLSTLISLTLGTVMCIICIFISLSIELKAIKKHA